MFSCGYILNTDTAISKPVAEVDNAVKVVQDIAKESGLEPDCIEALMDFITGEYKIDGCGIQISSTHYYTLGHRPIG